MTGLHARRSSDTSNKYYTGMQPRTGTALPAADYLQLQRHLEECEKSKHPAWTLLAYVLRDKIMMTEPVSNFYASDQVIGGSCMTYSVDRGPEQTGLLAHRARSASGINVIPVASLLGATLIGMTVGQRAPLLFDNGSIKSVRVLAVSPPT
ncbi:hypothetical protein ANTHELSMS3_03902 [Antarctobacter heliothermus]|uniref:Uncharacterized protein n=1 Tax=Antarctobacter heliothermus TaxID=74033 RepID=A0A222E8Z8_9RHOB|nr:hypothetical protein [Antarctobacter heliothermus]ASP22518.1 hypothetical protein ANTHELSMS3_03902 [Antarctobacter heliothermus]